MTLMLGRKVLKSALWVPFLIAGAGVMAQVPSKQPRDIPSPLTDHFYVRGSFAADTVNISARSDPTPTQTGTEVDTESDLGMNQKKNQGRMELGLRMAEDHMLQLNYLKLTRSGDSRLTRQIVFGGTSYNVNDRVQSFLDLRLLGLAYSYSILHNQKFEAGVGFGLHILEAEARGEVRARNIREIGNVVGVLPTLSVHGNWRIARRWAATLRYQYLGVGVNDIDGSFKDWNVDFHYRWKPNFALGIGYSALDVNVVSTDIDDPGQFNMSTRGPQAFFRVSF